MTSQNYLDLRVDDIQYFPGHVCPDCGAVAAPNPYGEWFTPFQDLYGSALKGWEGYFGYVRFACTCPHEPGPGLRVVRLGDALLPLPFASVKQARDAGLVPDVFNCRRVALAVDFLSRNADPLRILPPDPLRQVLLLVASGALGLEDACLRIRAQVNKESTPALDDLNLGHMKIRQIQQGSQV